MQSEIIELLNKLAEAKSAIDANRLHYEEIRKEIIPPEIRAQLESLDAEFAGKEQTAREYIDEISEKIKQEAIKEFETRDLSAKGAKQIKADVLAAQFNKGRQSVDTEKLIGYAVSHPEVLGFIKQGDPYITIVTKK